MSKSHLYAVLSACKGIAESGKSPSTALVKSKLSSHVPLPEIIKGIKYFQCDPQGSEVFLKEAPRPKEKQALSLNEEINSIKGRMSELEKQVIDLQAEVKALKQE